MALMKLAVAVFEACTGLGQWIGALFVFSASQLREAPEPKPNDPGCAGLVQVRHIYEWNKLVDISVCTLGREQHSRSTQKPEYISDST